MQNEQWVLKMHDVLIRIPKLFVLVATDVQVP